MDKVIKKLQKCWKRYEMNAFVHRDYTMTSDIKIEIFDDRLAISSGR